MRPLPGVHSRRFQSQERTSGESGRAVLELLRVRLPDGLEAPVRTLFGDAELLLALSADVLPHGDFGDVCLVATRDRLAVFVHEASGWRQDFHRPLAEIEALSLEDGVGGSVVMARWDGVDRRLVRLTSARRLAFSEAVGLLNTLREEGEWQVERLRRRYRICSRCGEAVATEMTVCRNCVKRGTLLRKVLRYSAAYRGQVVAMLLILGASGMVGLANPFLAKMLVDDVILPRQGTQLLFLLVGGMLAVNLAEVVLQAVGSVISAKIGAGAVHDIRRDMFHKLQELSLSFYAHRETGALIARVNQDTEQLQRLLVDFIPYGMTSVLMAVGILGLLFYLSWVLTLFMLVPIAGMVLFMRGAFPRLRRYWDRFLERRSRLTAHVSDVLSGVRVVKVFAQEQAEVDRFTGRSEEYREAQIGAHVMMAKVMPVLHGMAMSAAPVVWLIGGLLVFRRQMSLGDIVAYVGYLAMLFRPLFIMTRLAQLIPSALAAADRVFDVIDAEPEIADAPDAVAMPEIEGRVELREVTFGYDASKPVLRDIDAVIAPGEMVGLVGHSGAGKTTTINLLCRLYDVQRGQILIDGVDIRKIRYRDLRRQIGIVLQETFLFNGTIAENISYAKRDATPDAIVEAAMVANAHEFILRKPDGYDTIVTGGGENLSAGEKQRLAIARAVLADPRILILDEATGNVDLETEQKIQEALKRLISQRTTIAIAHRLSTLRDADRLVVLDKGRVAEQGSHEELTARPDGVYAKLVSLQRRQSEITGVAG